MSNGRPRGGGRNTQDCKGVGQAGRGGVRMLAGHWLLLQLVIRNK